MFIGLLVSVITITASSAVKSTVRNEVSGNGTSETHITTIVDGEETKVDSYGNGEITLEQKDGRTTVSSTGAKPTVAITNKKAESGSSAMANIIIDKPVSASAVVRNTIMSKISNTLSRFLGFFRKKA